MPNTQLKNAIGFTLVLFAFLCFSIVGCKSTKRLEDSTLEGVKSEISLQDIGFAYYKRPPDPLGERNSPIFKFPTTLNDVPLTPFKSTKREIKILGHEESQGCGQSAVSYYDSNVSIDETTIWINGMVIAKAEGKTKVILKAKNLSDYDIYFQPVKFTGKSKAALKNKSSGEYYLALNCKG
ncbi:MAG: hypothetical protein NTV34_08035 [Proteobacteria bacterium]|nr:hypothetical protein [Pseudomonadota bacterium]